MNTFLARHCVALCSLFTALTLSAQTIKTLSPLTSFGGNGDGSIRPGDQIWMDTASNQRGLAADPVTGNLILVDTHSGGAGNANVQGSIFVLDGTTGTNIWDINNSSLVLNTNGISGGAYADAPAAVADDGVVYVANQVTSSSSTALKVYRWDGVNDTNPPVVAFNATVTPSQRYGVSMDITGSGVNTRIIFGASSQSGGSGTNVLILTTADGTNFTGTVLGTDVTSPNFIEGVAFGAAANTFWAKTLNAPLRLMSYNLGTASAVTLKSWSSSQLVGSGSLGPISVDPANNLLAAMEETAGSVGGGPDHIWLYDISDTNRGPVLLDIKDYPAIGPPHPNNATAPPAYLDFRGSRLYTHILNNGMVAYEVSTGAAAAPTLVQQPAATNRVATGVSLTLSVLAYPAVTYQWSSNGVPIPNATNATLTLSSVTTNYAALYSCVVSNTGGTATANSQLVVVNPADLYHLNLLWRVGASDGQPFMNSTGGNNTPNQRTLGYNALSNHLYVVSRSSSTTSNFMVHVLNATNGNILYTLKTNGIQIAVGFGGIGLTCIDVAADGAIYACNESPNSAGNAGADPTGFFRIYRWADGNSNTLPTLVFAGDPASQSSALRWGDTLRVRGSGSSTRIIVDCNSREASNTKKKVAILTPTDEYCTNFTSQWIQGDNLPSNAQNPGAIGKSIEFDGNNNAYWQKFKSGWLVKSSFDPTVSGPFGFPNIDYSITTIVSNNLPNGLQGVGLDLGRNLMAGVFTNSSASSADQLNLYDITDLNSPLLLGQYSFPQTPRNPNPNFISQTFFAGDYVFTIDGNNGIMVFKVASGPLSPPTFVTQPKNLRLMLGGTGSMTVNTLETATYQWQRYGTNIPNATNATFSIANAQSADAGPYRAIASNPFAGSATSDVATVTVVLPEATYSLAPIWSETIGSQPYLKFDTGGSTPFQRSLGYSRVADQLFVISRTSAGAGLTVNVLDPATGAKLYELNTNGISLPDFTPYSTDNLILSMLGVADDGAIYAANLSMANNTTTNAIFRLWRWADSAPATPPVMVYEGEPANSANSLRWGDTFDVRGSGVNTEILIDNPRATLSAACVLVPTDGSMTAFTNRPFVHNYGIGGVLGRSAQFGPTNSFWQKIYGGPLLHSSYDTNAGNATILQSYTGYPATMAGLFQDQSRKLAVGVDFVGTAQTTPDMLNFYELSDPAAPLLIAKFNFPTNQQPNGNHFSHAVFTPKKVFVLDGNNGILALTFEPTLSQAIEGNKVILTWPTNFAGFVLQASPSITPPVNWTNVSPGSITGAYYAVTNTLGTGNLFYRLKH